MCLLLALPPRRAFLPRPLMVLTRQTRQAVYAILKCLHWQSLQSETVSDSDTQHSLQYSPRPPQAMQQEIETILSVSHPPRWPRQANSDCRCSWHYCITFAIVNDPLRSLFSYMSMSRTKQSALKMLITNAP